ncbi:MAG: radical SAM protein [Atopobiaceae bacterium]|nr:radical SAM protein [Atopobiaceae bacterium]
MQGNVSLIKQLQAKVFRHGKGKNGDEEFRYPQNSRGIVRQGAQTYLEGMPLAVNWRITDACNYRCSYCFAAGSSYKDNHCSLEQAETAIRYLASANRPSYSVTLVGGEPTAHPHLADIVRLLGSFLGDRIERIIIITNGNFDARTLDEIRSLASRVPIELVVSIHLEFARAEKIAALIEGLADSVRVRFSLMLHPDLLPKAQEMLDMFCRQRRTHGFEMYVRTLREPPEFAVEGPPLHR